VEGIQDSSFRGELFYIQKRAVRARADNGRQLPVTDHVNGLTRGCYPIHLRPLMDSTLSSKSLAASATS